MSRPCANAALQPLPGPTHRRTTATIPRGTSSPRATDAGSGLALPGQLVRETAGDRRVVAGEPFPLTARGKDPLAGEQHILGHLAPEGEAKGQGGRGDDGRAVEGGAEGAAEVAVANGFGRGDVVDPASGFGLERPFDHAHGVVAVDPGHPLPAVAE